MQGGSRIDQNNVGASRLTQYQEEVALLNVRTKQASPSFGVNGLTFAMRKQASPTFVKSSLTFVMRKHASSKFGGSSLTFVNNNKHL